MTFGGVTRILNVSLITDGDEIILVDAGLPGQEAAIKEAIEAAGYRLENLKRIIVTHQDLDHVGALHAVKEMTGATVLALDVETPYIDGSKPLVKAPTPERLAANPEFAKMWDLFKTVNVDKQLRDGDRLDIAGGVRIVATPGHTPGHMSLYLERTKTLITGDAMTSENGKLGGPMEAATPDMKSANESVNKLAGLDVETIICYHGGLVNADANGELDRVAAAAR